MRVIPIRRVHSLLADGEGLSLGITKACLGMLQNDIVVPGVTATGEYRLTPDLTSLRDGPRPGHISAWGEFREADGSLSPLCPRALLRRTVEEAAAQGLEFEVGFEVELVFMARNYTKDIMTYLPICSDGHAWSTARSMELGLVYKVLERAIGVLDDMGIYVEQFHPESALGQYEVVLPKASPLEAVETLLHVRDVISNIAYGEGWRVTL